MVRSSVTRILYFLILLFSCNGFIKGNNPSYYFQQLSLDKGLSQTTVNCILLTTKDWSGSGLLRDWTVSTVTIWKAISMKKIIPFLYRNTIYFLAEDSLNNIWISTNNGLTPCTTRAATHSIRSCSKIKRSWQTLFIPAPAPSSLAKWPVHIWL